MTQGDSTLPPRMAELAVRNGAYDHRVGRLVIDFHPGTIDAGVEIVAILNSQIFRTNVLILSPPDLPIRAVAVFQTVRLLDINEPVVLHAEIDGQWRFTVYIPKEHRVFEWNEDHRAQLRLSVLLSFPRSGSNFVQNVIESSTSVQCDSIYRMPGVARDDLCLKSHALTANMLRGELAKFWNFAAISEKRLVLIRDPRDVMISMFDYLREYRNAELRDDEFFAADYFWWFFMPDKIGVARDGRTAATTIIDAYRLWFDTWANRDDGALHLRYENIVADPSSEFARIFDYIQISPPASLKGCDELVSLNGTSERRRGQAQGWRHAPSSYAPIIEQTQTLLAAQIRFLGYG